ncbi:MAG TPA: NAD(P)-binding protein [Candidatus Bathyarchaeia archaeon]|nr:NAD(P)-binding protein [Candidatus Bathyarchaeia archaeon]
MKSSKRLKIIRNQLRQFLLPVTIFLLFWIIGFIAIFVVEDNKNFWNILLISMSIRKSETNLGVFSFYQFIWQILFEILIISFILSTLQEVYGYNPIMSARKNASKRKNHTVVLGYNHLGERIVEYLRMHKQPYSLVEIELNKVDDLIRFNQPVVVGDYTDFEIIQLAGIKRCKEVFCVTSDLRRALIAAKRVREINPHCDLYMRMFDDHFRKYLDGEPWNAFTFSTSDWAMESVMEWTKNISEKEKIVILGNDNLVSRIVEYLGKELKATVYLFDPEIDPDIYNDLPNVHSFAEKIQFIENLEDHFDMREIKQIYLCWNTEELFSDAIILSVAIRKQYPFIEIYTRMFDEELAEIAKTIDATTFSTSAYAFQMLQKQVKQKSGIYPKTP